MTNKEFVTGMEIISRHIPPCKNESYNIAVEHDQIWFGEGSWVTDENDKASLKEMGWFIDKNAWSAWV